MDFTYYIPKQVLITSLYSQSEANDDYNNHSRDYRKSFLHFNEKQPI